MRSVSNGAELARLFCLHAARLRDGPRAFFSWLHTSGGDPDRVTRQIVGSYITELRKARSRVLSAHGVRRSRAGHARSTIG